MKKLILLGVVAIMGTAAFAQSKEQNNGQGQANRAAKAQSHENTDQCRYAAVNAFHKYVQKNISEDFRVNGKFEGAGLDASYDYHLIKKDAMGTYYLIKSFYLKKSANGEVASSTGKDTINLKVYVNPEDPSCQIKGIEAPEVKAEDAATQVK